MKLSSISATKLRILLASSLFLIIAIAVAIFYFANTKLQEVATEVSHTIADSTASQDNLQTLQKIEKKLAEEKDTIERVNSIVADSQSYQYQNQILFDLNQYASNAGITISNLDFSAGASADPATPAPATSATPGAEAATPATPATPAPSAVKSTSVSVTLVNPIDYNALLRFMKAIEQNLTKMQISKVSLSKGTDANQVTSDSLTIEVYIK